MNEINLIASFARALPTIVGSLLECDALMREHEETQAMKYSQQEYLQSVYRLYKSRQITASEAKKAVDLIFREEKRTISIDAVEVDLLRLLGK